MKAVEHLSTLRWSVFPCTVYILRISLILSIFSVDPEEIMSGNNCGIQCKTPAIS